MKKPVYFYEQRTEVHCMGVSFSETVLSLLRDEYEQKKLTLRTITLFGGKRVATFAGFVYYCFEVPEETVPQWGKIVTCTIGTKEQLTFEGYIVELENQFLTIAFPHDFGVDVPEVQCLWRLEQVYTCLHNLLQSEQVREFVATQLFSPTKVPNTHCVYSEPWIPEQHFPEQREVVQKVFRNKVTLIWGPATSGKSYALALAAVNYTMLGKTALVVTPTSTKADALFLQILAIAQQSGVPHEREYTRYGFPMSNTLRCITGYSFAEEVEALKEKKRAGVRDQWLLLEKYKNLKRKQVLNEYFYRSVQELREQVTGLRAQISTLEHEIEDYTRQIELHNGSSLLQRVKKGFSREERETLQKRCTVAKQELKYLTTLQTKLSETITLKELGAPITVDEWKEYRDVLRQIDEFGGLETVQRSVDDFVHINENMVFLSKRLVCADTAEIFAHPMLWERRYDIVLVDDVQYVDIPTLYALSMLAREKVVVAGDPLCYNQDMLALSVPKDQQCSRTIFQCIAHTSELHKLLMWSKQNDDWVVLMKSHITSIPKVSSFISSVLYDDGITIFINPRLKGKLYFIDTTSLQPECKQYIGKKKIVPFNEQHTRVVLNCVKHALLKDNRTGNDIGIVLPFTGPTLYTKLQVRLQGMKNIEVGTPNNFYNRRKPVIIFDTTMAGVDYTMRPLDDKKVGKQKILELLNTVCSCASEDLYILADLSHFKNVYKDRLITQLLHTLHAEADVREISFDEVLQRYQGIDLRKREALFALTSEVQRPESIKKNTKSVQEEDAEFALRMKMMTAKKTEPPIATMSKNEERFYTTVHRVLGYWRDINLLAQYTGYGIVFHSSLVAERSVTVLPFENCDSDKQFRILVEQWNHIIYELSGGNEPFSEWCLQRNIETRPRYDIFKLNAVLNSRAEALLQEGKQKLAADVTRIFQEILGKPQPVTPSDWETLYYSMLVRLETYLHWIEEQIRKG
ncbi:MAG: hypothetical protein N3A63_03420 [Bacteroidetes bacterium]|nr:hypothetical protein [Bacteroidota bacterium]